MARARGTGSVTVLVPSRCNGLSRLNADGRAQNRNRTCEQAMS